MNFLKTLVVAGASAAVAFGSASAVTLSITGGVDTVVPLNFDPDEGVPGDVTPGVTMVKAFTGPATFTDSGLSTDMASIIKFTYLGSEASFTNELFEFFIGGIKVFDNQGDLAFSGVEVPIGPGFIPFAIVSDQGLGGAGDEGVGHNVFGNDDIVFIPGIALTLAFLKVTDTSAIVFFGDSTGDSDLDDLVFRIDVREVPIPGAALLFGTALLGGGFLRRRKKA